MENGLPLWPPLFALAFALVGYAYFWWEGKRLDKRWAKKADDEPTKQPGE